MNTTTRRRLLWMEDEPFRCEYEAMCIEEDGWQIVWANTVQEAATALQTHAFDVMIVDQMLEYPVGDGQTLSPWSACLLLRWLRASEPPSAAPGPMVQERYLWKHYTCHAANRPIPIIVISAFHDPRIEHEIRAASAQDHDILVLPKPIELERVRNFLQTKATRSDIAP